MKTGPVTAQTQLGGVVGEGRNELFNPLFTHQSSDAIELGEANLSRSVMPSRKQLADMGVCVDAGRRETCFLGRGAAPPTSACQLFWRTNFKQGYSALLKEGCIHIQIAFECGFTTLSGKH